MIVLGLKEVFNNMKREDGTLLKDLDTFLSNDRGGQDRRWDINSPSCAGRCPRANYFGRVLPHVEQTIDPRLRRIFENGDGVHERLQGYLEAMGRMMMSEIPVIDDDYLIQGHSDGAVTIGKFQDEVAVLEIKSINDAGWTALKAEKPEHKRQAMVYLHCLEKRRKYLHLKYPTYAEFLASEPERKKWAADHYKHLKSGRKFTREQKIAKKVKDQLIADEILYDEQKPISKVIFWYENKNTQQIKEYPVERDDKLIAEVLEEYAFLNKCVKDKTPPSRGGRTKVCRECTYCDFKYDCWL